MANTFQSGRFEFDLERPLVMGIVNITPDSFSDGGQHADADSAVRHGRQLIDEGAHLLDLGAESTRPGAQPVSAPEELARLLPVLEALRDVGGIGRSSVRTIEGPAVSITVGPGTLIQK